MENRRDLSSEYLLNNVDLQKTEKPIPYKEFLYHSKARDKEIEYRILKKITETKQHVEFLSNLPENHLQNRYHDILPYRDTMVSMSSGQYINANEISFSSTDAPRIIATQGPMSNTCAAFWRMVWEHDVSLIIMCCNFIENGMPKCFEYFSSTNSLVFDEFEILVLKEVSKLDFAIWKLSQTFAKFKYFCGIF